MVRVWDMSWCVCGEGGGLDIKGTVIYLKGNETKRTKRTKRTEQTKQTKRNQTKRNEMKQTKRNETNKKKGNETNETERNAETRANDLVIASTVDAVDAVDVGPESSPAIQWSSDRSIDT